MRALWVMTLADLRQRVRDRTVVIFGLVVPLGLIVVFNAVFTGSGDVDLEPVTVAVSAPEDDRLARTLVEVVGAIEALEVTVEPSEDEAAARQAVADAEADLALLVPDGFGEAVQAGRAVTVRVVDGGAGLSSDIVQSVVNGTVAQLHAAAVAARAGALSGVPPERLAAIARQASTGGPALRLTEGRAADEQLPPAGVLVAGQAGLFLLFTVGFGVLALLTEKEQGTLARLRSMPMRRELIVAAKAASGFVLGVLATTVLLTAGSVLFGVDFGSPAAIAVLVLSAVAAATSLTFVVVRLARTAEQAGVAQSILAMLLGIAGGAFFPLTARGWTGQLLDLNPVAALQRGLGITAGGGGVAAVGTPVAIMLGFAVACVLLSRALPDRGAGR